MTQSKGYAQLVDPDAGKKESDVLTCSHCQRVVLIRPFAALEDSGGFCRACMKFVCPDCEKARAEGAPCIPFEKKLDEIEAAERARQSYGV